MPEGSRAMAGIGCHGMAMYVPSRRTSTITHMGGEGANWIGQAPFTGEPHIFQNMGDGTYYHSGLLALRAAAAAGVNITYKILYNDAVAMTGGQPAEGGLTVGQIAHQIVAEGARRVAIVSDEPGKYPPAGYFPTGVTIFHRRELDALQRELRRTEGVTAIVYDQTCAAEKRRRRKRGTYPDPPTRAFINTAVCEGCGDCRVASNCISIQPVETGIRPQAPHRSIELQQGLLLRRGVLPQLRHRSRRPPPKGGAFGARWAAGCRASAAACRADARATV